MNRNHAAAAVAIAALAWAGALHAHHSIGMFDLSKSIWVKGSVVRYEAANPHVMVELERRAQDGQVQRWVVEGPNLLRLGRMNVGADFLKAGDVIEVCGFPFRGEILSRVSLPDAAGGARLPALHAHMLVLPDGHMRLFGPYGKLDNCIRPDDKTDTWVEFLNADPLGREAWCRRSSTAFASTAPEGFVDEINRKMANPCR